MRTGIHCIGAEDYHMQLMLSSQMKDKDIALVISHTGVNRDALRIADTVRAVGAHLCVITSYPRSMLARMADRLFLSASSPGSFISEAFSARIAQLALIDALYITIMEKLGSEGVSRVEQMRAVIAKRRM
ncbi:MAG: SIS domain-containing protein [Rectinema sp.]|nr:SIS domain-containing protein [Rectinema sp.]